MACGSGGILVNRLKEEGVSVYEIPTLKRNISIHNDLKALFTLYKLTKKGGYDVVHCHSTKAGLLGRFAAWFAGVKKIFFTVHGWSFYNTGEYGHLHKLLIFLEKIAANVSTKIICVSENDRREGIKNKIAPPEKFVVIHNGISRNSINKGKLRGEIDVEEKDIVFGMVARLAYPKNPMLFLEAAKIVSARYSNVKFVLVGDGPYYRECSEFIWRNGLSNAFLLGFRDNAQDIISDFDVFVLSSRFEGLPITIIEAMFAGLPVIATKVGGVGELVEHGRNGFLVDKEDANELASYMEYFIRHPEKIKEMGNESYAKAINNFTVERMVEQYKVLYNMI